VMDRYNQHCNARGAMRSEEEIRKLLKACEAVIDWGVSRGPCPLQPEPGYEGDDRTGCCAECTLGRALYWVLGERDLP